MSRKDKDLQARIDGLLEHCETRFRRLQKLRDKHYEDDHMDSVDRLDARLREMQDVVRRLEEVCHYLPNTGEDQ